MYQIDEHQLPDLSALIDDVATDAVGNLPMPLQPLRAGAQLADLSVLPSTQADADPTAAHIDAAWLAKLASDPSTTTLLQKLQQQAHAGFSSVVEEVVSFLQEDAIGSPASVRLDQLTDIRSLTIASRKGEQAGKSRRELAEAISIGSLINLDHPDWATTGASNETIAPHRILLMLLQMPLPQN